MKVIYTDELGNSYTGTVLEQKDGLFHIEFDDGEEGWEQCSRCEII